MDLDLLQMIDTAPDAIIVLDRDDRVVYWNYGALDTFGYDEDDMLGQPLDRIIPESLRQRHTEAYLKFIDSGRSRYAPGHTMAVPAMHKDGDRLSIEFRLSVEKDEAGEIQYVMAIIRDVTNQWTKLQELKQRLKDAEQGHIEQDD
ncbi:MAG TPA: PAS domain S-box protein [Tissierellia bacterium]|nr:PAS domain S-box protein [Tissierellia bacterium]